MNEDKDINEKKSPMSSEDMFNSWSQMLNEGGTSNNTPSNTPTNTFNNNAVQDNPFGMINKDNSSYDNNTNQEINFPKVNSHNSSDMGLNNVNNINNQMASLHNGPNDEKSNSVFTNIFNENSVNAQIANKINEVPSIQNKQKTNTPMNTMQNNDFDTFDYKKEEKVIPRVGRNSANAAAFKKPPKSLASKNRVTAEDENLKTSLVFLCIIIFGIGVFIYNTINNKKIEEDMNTNNNSSSVEKKPEKVEEIPDEEESNQVNNINTGATEELKTMCSLVDSNGNYQNYLTDGTNLDQFVETARYCQSNVCIYTKDSMVYSRNCQSGLEYKMTLEEMKVSLNLGFACMEYNKSGNYVDNNAGITCKDNHCGATLNGRSFNQNCEKYKNIK